MTSQEFITNFGENLERELLNSCTSRQELAEAVNVSVSTIGYYIRGERIPSILTLKLISQTLCCEISDLINDYEDIID